MILNKIYSGQQLTLDDVKIMLKMFFKIKEQKVKESSIDMFIKYMTKLNEHPFIEEFNKFKPLNQIIKEELVPTIENYLDVMKVLKNNEFIKFTFNEDKYEKLLK